MNMNSGRPERNKHDVRRSKRLSWLLRHGAREVGLPMDAAGWVSVPEVLRALSITRAQLEHAVATNRKRRLQLDGERVRACQGHSADGTPVTLEALEALLRATSTASAASAAGGDDEDGDVDMAAALITAAPTIFVYIVAGRYFVRGLMAGSVKG